MDKLDIFLYLNCKVLGTNQWKPRRFLSLKQGTKTRGPSISFSLFTSNGRSQSYVKNSQLRFPNQNMLQKWLWRFNFEDNTIWRKFISQKYGMSSQWTTEAVTSTYGEQLGINGQLLINTYASRLGMA